MTHTKVIKLIVTDDLRGDGVKDPFRRVTQLWTLNGTLIAEEDEHLDTAFFYSNKLRDIL